MRVMPTSWLLTTPAVVATIPLMRVARPIILDRSEEGSPAVLADEMNQDSKAEKRIEVENPPNKRPMTRIGTNGVKMHMQEVM